MIICHIVGINSLMKTDFINSCIEMDFDVFDLDDISKKIMYLAEYSKIYTEYIKPESIGLRKDLLSKLSNIWKNKFTNELDKILCEYENKKLILIGLSSFYLDQRIKIFIPTDNKFFIDISNSQLCEQTIQYNIDTYRDDIIKSKFPLKFLDKNNIILLREQTKSIYVNKGYELKNINFIIDWIKNKKINNTKIYYVSKKRFDNNFIDDYDIKVYTDKWMTLIRLFPSEHFKLGYVVENNIKRPYVKELIFGSLIKLKTCCYIYEIDNIFIGDKVNKISYRLNNDYNNTFLKREYISDIYDELVRLNVDIEPFDT